MQIITLKKPARLKVTALLLLSFLSPAPLIWAQSSAAAGQTRTISGVVVTDKNESVAGVGVVATYSSGQQRATTGDDGQFRIMTPDEPVTLRFEGKNIEPLEMPIASGRAEGLRIKITFVAPPVHETVLIMATSFDPGIDRRDSAVYQNTLFSRDDQIFHTLNAGINAGQHEGGGKSLEIRRFGFNLDHGGVNGGLKVLVDNVQQNHGTQGHGQGYLGQLKTLTPELVEEVTILNGPFGVEYGDFSGLGVVHIKLREQLQEQLNARIQAGSLDTLRSFFAYSPSLNDAATIIS
jgi:hypothetical protein